MVKTKVRTINPATEETIREYDIPSEEHLKQMVKKAEEAFKTEWRLIENNNGNRRADYMFDVVNKLRKEKERLATIATNEMGKAIKESRSEVEKCAWAIEYFADHGDIFTTDEVINTDARKSFVTFEPLGVIASIMPWNFPYWQALRFAAPSLMAGNTIVLKPASATMQCGLEIERIFEEVGLPKGVFQTAVGDYRVAEYLIDSESTNAVTFTGSVPVGSKVAQRATAHLKKTVLELGGSDPFIVCEDADIEKATTGAVKGRFINCGQSCIASKRFIVVDKVADEFVELFVQKTEKLRVGDPLSEDTDVGPLVNRSGLDTIEGMVKRAIGQGAELLAGGKRLKSKGYYYSPTVLGKIRQDMEIAREESFGPVAPILVAEDEKAAVKIANDSKFGLGASIWTQDLDKAERLSRMVESGIVTVNNVVLSDPRVPFGGIKNSGFGRELSKYGMLEFVNIKSVRFYDQLAKIHHVE